MFRSSLLVVILLTAQFSIGQSNKRFYFFGAEKEPQTWEEMTDKLISGKLGDSAKVMAIYNWITQSVSYDYSVYMSGQPIRYQSPEIVFKRRKTTCTGYSNLMVSMLERAGISATDVEGYTHDFTLGYDSTKLSSDHAWVAFKADGKWYLADPTWDAGEIGIYKITSKEIKKKSFWKRLKSFRFKNLFKKGKQIKKTQTRTKVTFKEGFVRKATTDYIFIAPEEFLKTHLPNVAHFQMLSAPISVEQFCDSTHSIGDLKYQRKGSFDYSTFNDQFEALEKPDKMLWISDSSLNYHYLNHGDKALNAHNYLASFYGERTSSTAILNKFISLSDTVILHAQAGIKINRATLIEKRRNFSSAFQEEKKSNNAQFTSLNYIKGHLTRTPEIYRKGRDRINLKEKAALDRMEIRIYDNVSRAKRVNAVKATNPDYIKRFKRITEINDSLKLLQQLELYKGRTLEEQLSRSINEVRSQASVHSNLLYQGEFLNEWQVTSSDKKLSSSTASLSKLLKDSVNTILSPRSSYSLLLRLDQEIKQQQILWKEWERKDTSFHADLAVQYAYGLLMDGMDMERQIIQCRLEASAEMEKKIRAEINPEIKEMGLDLQDLNRLRTMRQAYLNKMLNNKYTRSIKVYQSVLTNARNWKKNYQTRLKMLEEV